MKKRDGWKNQPIKDQHHNKKEWGKMKNSMNVLKLNMHGRKGSGRRPGGK